MTLQQLRYMITIAEKGSITEAAKELYISQPSLSGAIKDVEKEVKIMIFNRCRAGVALTTEGMEFLGYARQVVQQMELLESKYINDLPEKQRFCVSSQHYTFVANAFVELVQQFGQERYEFILSQIPRSKLRGIKFAAQQSCGVSDYRFAEILEDIHISCETALQERLPLVQVAGALAQKYEIFLRRSIQCPAHGSVENDLEQRGCREMTAFPQYIL